MVIIRQFIKPESIELQIQGSYLEDKGKSFSEMLKCGFKWNKYRRLYYKTYRDKEYIKETYQRDIDLIKNIWQHWSFERYKLIASDNNYDFERGIT